MSSEYRRILSDALIEDVISIYVPLKKRGKTFQSCCPFHDEKTPSFHVYTDSKTYCCFGCGVFGDAVDFLHEYLGIDKFEALKSVASIASLPAPQPLKRNEKDLAKEDAITQLWNACPKPEGFGAMLNEVGWDVRNYDPAALQAKSRELAGIIDDIGECGLPQVHRDSSLIRLSFPNIENGWVVPGRKLGDSAATTGFTVIQQEAGGTLKQHQHLSSPSSPACIIVNQKTLQNRLTIKEMIVTDDPLRAMKANKIIPSACPAAGYWRPQDIRNMRSAFPNTTFVFDGRATCDKSLYAWLTQLGARSTSLLCLPDLRSQPEPALTYYTQKIIQSYKSPMAGDSLSIEQANGLLEALSNAPESKLMVGSVFNAAGIPVTYSVEIPEQSKSVIRRKMPDVDNAKSLPRHANEARLHLLEAALANLPYLSAEHWKKVPPAEFGDHSCVALAISDFLEDPTTKRLDPNLAFAAFWSFSRHLCGPEHIPDALITFWQNRLAANPGFWAESPALDSYSAKSNHNDMAHALEIVSQQIERTRLLELARTAQIDHEAEETLRATYEQTSSA